MPSVRFESDRHRAGDGSRQPVRRALDDAMESPGRKKGKRQGEDRNEPPSIVAEDKSQGGQDRHVHQIEAEGDPSEPLRGSGFECRTDRPHCDSREHEAGRAERR